jgi:oligoribonuclease
MKTILTWVDLETTGLDEKNGAILEYAVILTDLELDHIDHKTQVIRHNPDWINSLLDFNPIAKAMHIKSGLLDAIQSQSKPYLSLGQQFISEQEAEICQMLQSYKQSDTIAVLAGSSVSFDRRWLKVYMPKLESMLHYRQLDVSVYKVGFPEIFGTKTSEAHRAMPDIMASIDQHRKMRELILK